MSARLTDQAIDDACAGIYGSDHGGILTVSLQRAVARAVEAAIAAQPVAPAEGMSQAFKAERTGRLYTVEEVAAIDPDMRERMGLRALVYATPTAAKAAPPEPPKGRVLYADEPIDDQSYTPIAAPLPEQAEDAPTPIQWPKARYVGRMGDMTPPGRSVLRVCFDSDNDVIVEVWEHPERDEFGRPASVEFCNGGGGGGGSPETRKALIALMVAIEKDNAAAVHKADPLAARLGKDQP